jgi:hypothetical protein
MTTVTASAIPGLEGLLREMVRRGASDLHLAVGARPALRIDGILTEVEEVAILSSTDTKRMAEELLTSGQRRLFEDELDLDFSFEVAELARFRGNCFRQRGRIGLAIRLIPHRVGSLEELGLPPIMKRLAARPRGLVLVTGPTGCGKSTTLAAMVDLINRRRRGHIITVEDPVEFVHAHRRCIVNQREVGVDTRSFAAGLKHALRQDPDGRALVNSGIEAVKAAVALGADVNAVNEDGDTALHLAAHHGFNTVVRYLVSQGANPNAENARGHTPLDRALGVGRVPARSRVQDVTTADLLRELGARE